MCVWTYTWVFNSILLVRPSVFLLVPGSFYYYSSVAQFEVWDGTTSISSFIIQNCFSYAGIFVFL